MDRITKKKIKLKTIFSKYVKVQNNEREKLKLSQIEMYPKMYRENNNDLYKNKNSIKVKKSLKEFTSKKFGNVNKNNSSRLTKNLKIYFYFKNKINLFLLNLLIIFLYVFSSKQNSEIKELSIMQEIVITIKGSGEKSIFNKEFNYSPDIIYINEKLFTPNPEFSEDFKHTFNFSKEENIIKVYYKSPPEFFQNMFKDLSGITKIDLSNFDTSNVKDMNSMFFNCEDLEYVNLTNWNTSSVTNMQSMFQGCKKLKSLDLSSFDTSSVIYMSGMFLFCENLINLNISNFNTFSAIDMSQMFCSCTNLELIDISSFKTSGNTNINRMFYYCLNLKSIIFPENNKIAGSSMESMFQECQSLTSLDLSNFDTSSTTSLVNMFNKCNEILSLDLSNFNTSSAQNMECMFCECKKIERLDLSNFDTSLVISFRSMFYGCDSLKFLNLKSFSIDKNADIYMMFDNFPNDAILFYDEDKAGIIKLNYGTLNNQCSNNCFSKFNKLIIELNICIEDCNKNDIYKYEYNNKCYKECPNGTTSNNDNICEEILNCTFYNIDKSKCFNYIPDGYFLIDEKKNLIDECHENCKECNKKYTEENNNCLICKNGYFFDNGNCLKKCKYGNYVDYNGNQVCTCSSNIKCKECSEESLKVDSCISCNSGYFQIINNSLDGNEFIKCYKNPDGYYLHSSNYYYPCYSTCNKCNIFGNEENHNCQECLTGYTFISDSSKRGNCYIACSYLYFFDELNYKCTDSYICPSSQSKLIINKKKCIDECKNDDLYINEYNNQCYISCPENTISENNYCKNKITEKDNENTEKKIDKTFSSSIENTLIYQDFEKTNQTSKTNKIIEISQTTIIQETQKTDNSQITQITYIKIPIIPNTQIISTSNPTILSNEIIETNWTTKNFFLGLYKSNEQKNLSKDDIIKNIREDIINHNIDSILLNITEGNKEDLYIKENNVLYQITTTDNQNNKAYKNFSTINLGNCEDILKEIYKIDKNQTLIILKIDYFIEGLLILIIGYDVFHPVNKSKLDLSYCEESSINYNIPVSIDEDNLYKYDPNSDYYNDECYSYTTENGTDIILNDRKEEFSQNNMSLCENICTFTGYDSDSNKALCECGIKYKEFLLSEVDNQTNLLANNFTTDNSTSNINTLKCYNTLFSKDGLLTNIGSYILLFIIIVHMISSILFYKCGYQIIDGNIKKIIKKIKKSNINKTKSKNEEKKNKIFSLNKPRKLKNKKKKIQANPSRKFMQKKEKGNKEDSINITNNTKSFSKLKTKEKKIISKYEKGQTGSTNILKSNIKKTSIYKSKKNSLIYYNDFELNTMKYKDAIEIDKRSYIQYYISLLRIKHPIIFSFFPIKDYNILIIKICLFFLSFAIYYTFNTIFFDYSIIHKIYVDQGNYDLSYLFPIIMYSFILSYFVNIIIKYITLSERNLLELKIEKSIRQANDKVIKIRRCLIIKYIIYFIISFLFLSFFWYYLSSFCAVYQNSQVYLIKNTFIGFAMAMIFPFIINLLPGIFRIYSLNDIKKKKECIYIFSKILQLL